MRYPEIKQPVNTLPHLIPPRANQLTLLSLVAETTGLLRTGGTRAAVDARELSVLPASNSEQVSHHITLLLAPYLLHVLVGSHNDLFFLLVFSR